jgi:hypothetical protein
MGRLWSLTFFVYILHKVWLLVSAITLYSIFDLFVVRGSSQAMACVSLWLPTQHQVKGLNQVDQDAHKLKGSRLGAPTIHMLSCIWYLLLVHFMGSVLQPLPGREEHPLESNDYPNKGIIHHAHYAVVVSLIKTYY